MPGPGEAVSAKQRSAMAIGEHDPDKLYSRNKSMLNMTKTQQHNFAATKGLGAPKGASNPNMLTKTGRPRNPNSKQSSLLTKPKIGGLNGGM